MTSNEITITEQSLELFLSYANDACNWGGTPLVGGNVVSDPESRGNLTQLKRSGLVTTEHYDGLLWLQFTAAGKEFAAAHGIKV